MLNRRLLLQISAGLVATSLYSRTGFAADWNATTAEARGQTVFFNAWAGADNINTYIAWVGEQVKARFDVNLTHVKITDTAEVVKRVRDEVQIGKNDGSVDLVWINGENFRVMKSEKLLFGPFGESLPNFALVDTIGKPTTLQDFSEKVAGLESPWGMAQLTFFGDGAKITAAPRSMTELVAFAKANPGRISYPAPPDFHGMTFLKQVLLEVTADSNVFAQAIESDEFALISKPWLALLDDMRPFLWREGKQYPKSQAEITQMVSDGELLIGLTFNPNEPANLVSVGTLPKTTIAWQHATGTIGNCHFVAIPTNAKAKAGAQIVANFLLSAEAQARKSDLKVWGDPTVLDMAKLNSEDAKMFTAEIMPGSVSMSGPAIVEPHGSFVPLIEASWLDHYGKG